MTDKIKALERLARLRDAGTLTQDEFLAHKAALLESAPAGGNVASSGAASSHPGAEQLDKLEQLAKLHATGALTDAEFAAQKAALLGAASDEEPDPPHFALRVAGFFAGLLLLIAIFFGVAWFRAPTKGPASTATAASSNAEFAAAPTAVPANPPSAVAAGDGWTVKDEKDPMSDQHVVSASTTLAAAPFSVQVTASCTNGKAVSYQFAAFDADGQAAPFQTTMRLGNDAGEQASFEVRADQTPAQEVTDYAMRYNNAVTMRSATNDEAGVAEQAARAHHVTVRLPLINGEPVVTLDQDAPEVRTMLDRCVAGMVVARAKRQADAAAVKADCPARVAKAKADTAAYVAELKRQGKYVPDDLNNGADNRFDRYGNNWERCEDTGTAAP